ncbi:MAG: phosphoglucomutase/phosphomannomutase family protein [Candidatus Omnitrophota bacterium]
MAKIHFGTDGWRAVISDDFTFENVKIAAQAIADYVKGEEKRARLIVGYDTRFLSEKYAELISCVLAANGIKVVLTDSPTPTPSVSFNIKHRKFTGGVMVTASHNPGRYNGIKYKMYFGGSAGKEITDVIESRLHKSRIKFIDKKTALKRGLLKIENIIPLHLKFAKQFADMPLLKKAKLKILVDSMNGAGASLMEEVLKETNIKVTTINAARDPYFGGRPPEPNEVHLQSTAKVVRRGRFDVALAMDGDADRLGVILPSGKILSGHKVMTLLLLHLLEDRNMTGGVVQTICGTGLVDKICKVYGLATYETAVGFKYIAEIFNKNDILLGGEETGGVAFKGWLPERDAILSGLLILEMITYRKKGGLPKILENINKTYGIYVYKRLDLRYTKDRKKKLMARLKKKPFKKVLGKAVVRVKSFDGFKFVRSDGSWFMLRPSGTEPKLRVYSEGRSEKEAKRLVDFGKRFALGI